LTGLEKLNWFKVMTDKLRILLLEDSAADAEMIKHELEEAGFSFSLTRVETEAMFLRELEAEPDLVLSDHGLPSFSGFSALEIVRSTLPQLPFIFVSGSNDQEMVVDMYEQGATDYVFKRDLKDLRSAVHHALEPQPEPPTAKYETMLSSTQSAQPELQLKLPALRSAAPVFAPAIGHLLFCPHCHRSWDEFGNIVRMEDYCGNHIESVVIRQACGEC
jgi:CheY-like chemotaxis protein